MFSIGNDELEQTCNQIYAGDLIQDVNTFEVYKVINADKSDTHSIQYIKTESGETYMVGLWNKLVNKNFKIFKNG